MSSSYARVTISAHDVGIIYTSASCLYLKNDMAHGVASNLGQIGYVVLLYTRPTRVSVNPQVGSHTPWTLSSQANL